jgi:hypothetical protein
MRYYDDGQMVGHCICLLSYVSTHREEPQSISNLANRCGIPKQSLWEILNEARCYDDSILRGVALTYGYDFHVFSTWNSMTFPSPKGCKKTRVLDVVKLNGNDKYKYDNSIYYD